MFTYQQLLNIILSNFYCYLGGIGNPVQIIFLSQG